MDTTVLLPLVDYKTWGDREMMHRLCELESQLPSEVRDQALRMMNHIHVVDAIFIAHLRGQTHPYNNTHPADLPTAEVLSWRLEDSGAQLLALARQCPAPNADQRIHFRFTDGDHGGMNASEMLLHVCVHSTYHRGQVGQMLKDAGLAPPRELLTRLLHTREPERRTLTETQPC